MKNDSVLDDYKILLRQIGVNLAKARTEKGVSQRELARGTGKNQSMVAKVEKFAPPDISLRNIFEVAQLIPVSLGEIILKAERELEMFQMPREERTIDQRVKLLMEKMNELPPEERNWVADMMEGLLARTSSPSKLAKSSSDCQESLAANS